LPHVIAQARLGHSLGLTLLAAFDALGDLRHFGGKAVLDVLPPIGAL
jgi:hypothetical protein